MEGSTDSPSSKEQAPEPLNDLVAVLSQKVVGQPSAMKCLVPYIQMYKAGLAPEGRPVGVFLLLGPTGTGKTKTVEAIAEILHGSEKNVLKIDCGEFQMEHEVAKLIGAPPGYLGHRETEAMLTQQRLEGVASESCDLSVVLFDEIEKAAPTLTRLLLGVLDKAAMRLGDNTTVNFEKSLIFLTSNLGAREMMKELHPDFGFLAGIPPKSEAVANKLENIALAAVRKRFSPEFVNRIDAVITYHPLDAEALAKILDQQIAELQRHVITRLGSRCFSIELPPESRQFLLDKGTSPAYGARELKRTVHRYLTQPLAALVAEGKIKPGARVRAELTGDREGFQMRTVGSAVLRAPSEPTVLIVDDNPPLLHLVEQLLGSQRGWRILTAESAHAARAVVTEEIPKLCLLDVFLPDGNGIDLGVEFKRRMPELQIVIMTGGQLLADEEAICQEYGFPVLHKPFLPQEMLSVVKSRLARTSAVSA